ncbi:MAG: DUF2244 domain-containing protein [Acetobacteraceae bacterium]|jgi:uncharacterized membrane protein|nr:DUF2244 domain-containing protein [Acetobacteraceae bacterium]
MTETGQSAPLFHAVLTAQRSLGARGLAWAGGVLGALAVATIGVFLALGAWPVAGFVGVEVGAAVALLWLHHRAGRAREEVRLDDEGLTITRIDHHGRRAEERLQPAWARVALRRADAERAGCVQLASHGRTLSIGAFLTEEEQEELAAALERALARWREPARC